MPLSIEPRKEHPPRILIYGKEGAGKTTFGATCPFDPIFMPLERGLVGYSDVPSYPVCGEYDQFIYYIGELLSQDHDRKTLVIDSATRLNQLIYRKVCQENNVNDIEDILYGKGYPRALKLWNDVVVHLNNLNEQRNMMIVWIGHAIRAKITEPGKATYDSLEVDLHKQEHADLLTRECDIVFYAEDDFILKASDKDTKGRDIDNFGKVRREAMALPSRSLYTHCKDKAYRAKSRYDTLPGRIEFDKAGSFWLNEIAPNVPFFNQHQ